MKNIRTYEPDGLKMLKEIRSDLLRASADANSSLSAKLIQNLMMKVSVAIEIIDFIPRLPLYQIEESVKEICRNDPSTHGVNCKLMFSSKHGEIDLSKMSELTVKI
ncbi:hypothetical protein ACW5R3_05220 [Bizionia sp. KMM 8389]